MENNLEILTQPIIPPVLHYIAPRKIMGENTWNKLKAKYRKIADHHCMICGEYVSHTPGDWLELHEIYEYDVPKRIQKITGVVSICHDCHMYIHYAFLDTQVRDGKVSESERERIMARGDMLLLENGLEKKHWTPMEFRDNESVTFQMMPNRNGLELFISKVNPDGEGEIFNPLADLEKQGKKVRHIDMSDIGEDDNIADFIQRQLEDVFEESNQGEKNAIKNSKRQKAMHLLADEEKSYLVELDDFEDFLSLVKIINSDEITSDLYFLNDKYYLKLTFYPDSISDEQIKDFMAIAYEYGRQVKEGSLYIQEHGKLIMEHASLEIAQHYFD